MKHQDRDRRHFGHITKLPSGRYRARYADPTGALTAAGENVRYAAPWTFDTKQDAEAWLTDERRMISAGVWTPPPLRKASRPLTFGDYANKWMSRRDLKPRTHEHYQKLLDTHILPTLAPLPLAAITRAIITDWYADLDRRTPTYRAHAYALVRTILGTAVTEERIPANPCQIRGAGTTKRRLKIEPATLDELRVLAQHMPPKYRVMVLLASWCALRFGELTELRRRDLDLINGVIKVRRGVTRAKGEKIIGTTKSDAGARDVTIPPHLIPLIREHLDSLPMRGRDTLLFPAADGTSNLAPSSLYRHFYPAREAAGRPDLRWHDLRHTGAVLAAQTGATLAELMERLGHSTPQAALKYQHAAQGRAAEIAAALSRIAEDEDVQTR